MADRAIPVRTPLDRIAIGVGAWCVTAVRVRFRGCMLVPPTWMTLGRLVVTIGLAGLTTCFRLFGLLRLVVRRRMLTGRLGC